MSSALCRNISATFIRSTMSAQRLSRCFGQRAGQHTTRTTGLTTSTKAALLSRPCAFFRPTVQLQFSRTFMAHNSLRSSLSAAAQHPDTVESGQTQHEAVSVEAEVPSSEQQQPFPGVQSDSGVEIVSEAIPTEAVLSASVTETNSLPAESNTTPTSTPDEWQTVFQSLLDVINEGNHFEGRVPTANAFSISVLKRGILNFARSRQDILFALPAEKIQAVLEAGPPYKERKVCLPPIMSSSRQMATTAEHMCKSGITSACMTQPKCQQGSCQRCCGV